MAQATTPPPVSQTIRNRRFAGFTPSQINILLQRKGLDPNSSGAARYLASMTRKAEDKLLMASRGALVRGYQEGGMPENQALKPAPTGGTKSGGFTGADTKGQKKLDAAQANLAKLKNQLSKLQQELATIPTGKKHDEARADKEKLIRKKQAAITAAEAAVVSAQSGAATTDIPTGAELVSGIMDDPTAQVKKADVTKIGEEDAAKGDIAAGTGALDDTAKFDDTTITKGTAETIDKDYREGIDETDYQVTADKLGDKAKDALDKREDVKGTISDKAKMEAEQMDKEDLAIKDVEADQIADEDITQVDTEGLERTAEEGELLTDIGADAEDAKKRLDEAGYEAATGAPSSEATVKGQLTGLMADFEGGDPPAWAAGAMRAATAAMAARGMGASSMAGQAIFNAAMESALPIAMKDAATHSRFEEANLSNRQAMAVLASEQYATFIGKEYDQEWEKRTLNAATISDIADKNFDADVRVALENANLVQTANLANLNARNALTIEKAAAMQQLDMKNLDNRQQAAKRNADAILEMDMANLEIEQQNDTLTRQAMVDSMFNDQAAENAAKQFNASSKQQADEFFTNVAVTVDTHNNNQKNAMEQFNVGEENALIKFQDELENNRDQFNATNELIVSQANAQWRQDVVTTNNATENEANRLEATEANNLSQKAMDEIWQKERDLMAYAFASAESAAERKQRLVEAKLNADKASDAAFSKALGLVGSAVVTGIFS